MKKWLGIVGVSLSFTFGLPVQAQGGRAWPGLPSKKSPRTSNNPESPDYVSPRAPEPEPEPERISGAELQKRLPQLRTRSDPRSRITLALGTRLWSGISEVEGTYDAYPVPLLRIGAIAGVGLAYKWQDNDARFTAAFYAELVVGLRLWSTPSRTEAELQLGNPFDEDRETYKSATGFQKPPRLESVHAQIPSSHSMFVETGVIDSYFPMRRCVEGCAENDPAPNAYADASKQLVAPFAGFRYVYYSEAVQERPIVNRVRYTQVFAHAIFRPIWQPTGSLESTDGDAMRRVPVGGRLGILLPVSAACRVATIGGGCLQVGVSGGYTAFPALALFSVHLNLPLN